MSWEILLYSLIKSTLVKLTIKLTTHLTPMLAVTIKRLEAWHSNKLKLFSVSCFKRAVSTLEGRTSEQRKKRPEAFHKEVIYNKITRLESKLQLIKIKSRLQLERFRSTLLSVFFCEVECCFGSGTSIDFVS